MRLPLATLAVTALVPTAHAQLGAWHRSPSRPEVWYARFDLSSANYVSGRARAQRELDGLAVELASITTAAEETTLRGLTGGSGYLGLTDFGEEGVWRWLDGTPLTYENWDSGEPVSSLERFERDFAYFGPGGWATRDADGSGGTPALLALVSDDCDGDLQPDAWEIWAGLEPDLDGNGVIDICDVIGANYCTATVNSSGAAASISASGSPTVAVNDFRLVARETPPHSVGFFLASTTQDFVPMFAGTPGNLCLGAPIIRLEDATGGGVLMVDGSGFGSLDIDLALVNGGSPVLAGETWNFQYWMRDQFTSNTTDGVSVTFM